MELPSSRVRNRSRADVVSRVRDDSTVYLYPYPVLHCDLSFSTTFTSISQSTLACSASLCGCIMEPSLSERRAQIGGCTKRISAKMMRGGRTRASAASADWYLHSQNLCARSRQKPWLAEQQGDMHSVAPRPTTWPAKGQMVLGARY
jgi:hypothetical protein